MGFGELNVLCVCLTAFCFIERQQTACMARNLRSRHSESDMEAFRTTSYLLYRVAFAIPTPFTTCLAVMRMYHSPVDQT